MYTANVAFASIILAAGTALGLVYGTFDTQEVRPWDVPGQEAAKLVTFPVVYPAPPSLAVGLTALDVSNGADIRVSASPPNITRTSALLHLDTWADTRLYSAASIWFAISDGNPGYQTGRFNTVEDHPWYLPQQNTSRRITFARPYAAPPRVVVWLNSLDMDRSRGWRISATATAVTATGFTLNLNTWADTILYSAGATWVAYPSESTGISSGVYSTYDVRNWNPPQLTTSGTVAFPAGTFERVPTVLFALNFLDVGYTANLRMRASVDPVSHTGMAWHFDGWADSVIYSAGASYIAFSEAVQ
ncbi:hypothetical protein AURDEDRAFT_125148 [Auricularia subglabra TFB-10046 SS5]|uniref:H-type lectin domain-containing protein n=1 Tax=Auricularia subglabra (strain TFB-10046 / SS5) TaxID=717982 RepID=J0WXQ9_AURST|nr:hypothetical protein AURDEDRAFT_125148 [Auricularia subglabra TFB-10046 SS5]